ncbi:ABC transporter permease [Kutzneria kofuensis]|uniref:ABC-2 type transport system permease protein n=1 Tax=Kutzneria kofuensis TaxID=103725 RepID=A0A7W9KIU3_9PSEU|nr:ABC-2 family transporter protein [Kutzneria kofuensis]MBB5893398.1 ABC-2 type transport system permease protein [Kutzneria kofuensis]
MADLSVYARLARAQVRGQLSYRGSFAMNILAQALAQASDLAAILIVFGRVASLGGFDFHAVLLLYALSGMSFGLADLSVGSIERLPTYIRTGSFDVVLMRPLATLFQLFVSDFQLRRIGRVITALGTLVYVLSTSDIHWSPAKVLLLVLTPLAGATIFGSIFVAANSVSFWFVDARELANTVTYGGSYLTSYPITVFSGWLRTLLGYIVPGAFVAYYPALTLLDHADPLGAPTWFGWLDAPVTVLTALVAGLLWRTAVRHYRGTGS